MKVTAEFLQHALQFEQLAGEATDAEDRARMLEQAQAYRNLADERAVRMKTVVEVGADRRITSCVDAN
jgi:hypothetical protein